MRNKRRYPGVAGKKLGYIETFEEDGDLFVAVRFSDETSFTLVVTAQPPRIQSAHLTKRKDGEVSVIRTYVKRRDRE